MLKTLTPVETAGTHGGAFHPDDLFAMAVILALFPNARIVRTRNLDILAKADVVVDVGGEWDPARGRFDHHQKGFSRARADGTVYAAAGLVWEHYGAAYVAAVVSELSPEEASQVADMIDHELVRHIDMTDTGQGYNAQGQFGLSMLLANLNMSRLQKKRLNFRTSLSEDLYEQQNDNHFRDAVKLTQNLLWSLTMHLADEVLSATAVRSSGKAFSGRVLVLDEPGLAWQKVVVTEMPEVLFVVFPDNAAGGYMIQSVPTEVGGFVSRKPFPEQWAGLRFKDLAAVNGVGSSVFCHNARFIAGAGTKEDALKMAELALA
jgi:uncharacterized UPF0160 family protein